MFENDWKWSRRDQWWYPLAQIYTTGKQSEINLILNITNVKNSLFSFGGTKINKNNQGRQLTRVGRVTPIKYIICLGLTILCCTLYFYKNFCLWCKAKCHWHGHQRRDIAYCMWHGRGNSELYSACEIRTKLWSSAGWPSFKFHSSVCIRTVVFYFRIGNYFGHPLDDQVSTFGHPAGILVISDDRMTFILHAVHGSTP